MIVSETTCVVPDFGTMKTFTWTVGLADALSQTRSRRLLFEDEFFYLKLGTTDCKIYHLYLVVEEWKGFMSCLYWKAAGILSKGTVVYSYDCSTAVKVSEKDNHISLDFNEHNRKSTSDCRPGRTCVTVTCELILKKCACLKHPLNTAAESSSHQSDFKSRSGRLEHDLKWLLQSGYASDTIFHLKDGQRDFPVHRAILAARSPVFEAMFNHELSERRTGVIEIVHCDPETFRKFLHYLYTGDVEEPSPEVAICLYELADKYQVEQLKEECLEYIANNLCIEAFCHIITLALTHNLRVILEIAKGFFARNIKYIIITDDWRTFLGENPEEANDLLVQALIVRTEDENRARPHGLSSSSRRSKRRKREW